MDNAVIVGNGMVGKATAHAFGIKEYYDIKESTVGLRDLANYRYIFICLPTPTVNGKCFTKDIVDVIKEVRKQQKNNIFILRSTVAPGTTLKIIKETKASVVHVPEFLTESTWKRDSEWPDLVVIGSEQQWQKEEVFGVYRARYKGANFVLTDTITSETIKYAINSLYATKVVFANQLFDYCSEHDINYEAVKKAMYHRKWIGKNHLRVFDDDGKRGAGGKCLSKDLEAFANHTDSELLKFVDKLNKEYLNA